MAQVVLLERLFIQLALGIVAALRPRLDAYESLRAIEIIDLGGAGGAVGMARTRSAGAAIVGTGNGLAVESLEVLARIWQR